MDKPRLLSSVSKGISGFVLSGEKAPAEPKLSLNTTSFIPRARLKDAVSLMYDISQRRNGACRQFAGLRERKEERHTRATKSQKARCL